MVYNSKDYAAAAVLFAEFLDKYPESPSVGQAKSCLDACKKAIKEREEAAIAKKAAVILAEESPVSEPKKPRSTLVFDRAETFFNHKLYKEALAAYRQVKNDAYCHERGAACHRMGQCYAELGNTEQAIRHWQEAVKLSRNDTNTTWVTQSLKSLGDAYFEVLADTSSALGAYYKLVESYPESVVISATLKQIGLVYLFEDRPREAKAIFEELVKAKPREEPDQPPSELDRLIAFCDGRKDRNMPVLRTARDNRWVATLRRAEVYFLAKDYERALMAYKAVEMLGRGSEDGAYSMMQAGRCYNQLRRHKEALQCYERFLDDYKKSQWADDALVRACVVYVGPLNNPAMGAKMCEVVLREHPDGDQADVALLHLATLAYWKKDWKRAQELHEQLLRQYPKSLYSGAVEQVRLPEIRRQMELARQKGKAK